MLLAPVGEKDRNNGRHRVTVDLLRELSASLDALTNAASPHSGLNRTDIRALDIINLQRGLTAGQLADRLKLTTGAITGVLDRLERAGQARRAADSADRRRVVVQPTSEARRLGSVAYRQLGSDLDRLLAEYTAEEQEVIDGFLRSVIGVVGDRADELAQLQRARPERAKRPA
jgi:DNA-binding MarR family transcriptional regulator